MKILKHILVSILFILNIIVLENIYAESFSNYSSLGGSAERSPNKKIRKSCNTYICGPISTIELSMTPSPDVGGQNYNIGESSTFDQMLELGDDFNKLGPADIMKQMRDVQNVWGQLGVPSDRTDAKKEIKITIPMIDYGFSGTFNKILISVSENNKRPFKSISQGLTNKDDQIKYTGSITIEKYTPYILKGSYSAPLNRYIPLIWQDMRLLGRKDRNCPAFSDLSTPPCIIYRLEGTGKISGQFNILSPWRGDDRINDNVDMKSSYIDPFKNDIKGKMAQFGIDIDVDIDKAFAKVDLGKGSRSSSSTGRKDIYGGCNCSCNFVQTATTQCKAVCSAAFSACKGERYKPPQKTAINQNAAASLFPQFSPKQNAPKLNAGSVLGIDQNFIDNLEKGNIKIPKNLRSQYISALKKKMPGTAYAPMREMMVKGFDETPDNKSKMIMLKSMGGN